MMRRLVVAAAALVACHNTTATTDPVPVTTASHVATLPVVSEVATVPPPPPITTAPPPSPQYIDDVGAWLRARNAKLPHALENGASCTAEKIGTNDALLCHGAPDSLPTGESVYPISIWIVSGGMADLALSAAGGAGPLDREIEPGSPSDDMYVELDVTISGTTVTIADRPKKPCTQVLAQYTSHEWDGHRRVVQKACAARGRYVLQNGKLVRAP